ncbi:MULTISPECIES: hypothetical protein [Chryseobacterium]|uniref:Lipoprotein n=1 Tax=Chryseobacterium camelliae TaxID=1265445 RepID=A0ABU0TMH3_9FLAO|nr:MULTISPECIES: hypothetical protein [Chryseobacterium]MDT3407900.1 hypothetical protein [Pseudacidovorax intermedius]MDQ1098244.1 hypothetical protein [Chryseobacterium camelliae]MDQ1102170.1 hypothetical protein [Chryseobacterium sp. SORGH_AS_1048]MDR6085608.1 hypothetical protein [Chryseobacterium sp. SORGH_AS_0909]MDR6129971.1 hypothetical protein [Chryseobacterium sp. SORGH_AS_1175]
MKNSVFALCALGTVFLSCSKKEPADLYPQYSAKADYDTAAVDSFSQGATSIDVIRQIRMSSKQYQDSVKEASRLQAEKERIAREVEKENKQKLEEEKKKAAREKQQAESPAPAAN